MKIALGADHAGYRLKNQIAGWLQRDGREVQNLGTDSEHSVDYPDYARAVAQLVASGEVDRGILVCGTGVGMAMTANKVAGARAVNCTEHYTAAMSRAHNDANILCLGARVIGPGLAEELVKTFLESAFEGGRHSHRVAKIEG